MLNLGREHSAGPVESDANYSLAPVETAIRRVLNSGNGTRSVKAEILSLCRRARRDGTPVEALVLDLHRMLDRQDSPWSRVEGWDRELRQKLVCYLIATYHREGPQ
jgi:hypothetical protein